MRRGLAQIQDFRRKSGAGFTLMEILVVIAIFSVLVTISGYVYASSLARSRDHQRLSDLQTIDNGLEQFYLDNKEYPRYGDQSRPILLAKFRLEPQAGCQPGAYNNKYLVPTQLTVVPEDPRYTMTLVSTGGSCDISGGQAGQYLYVPLTDSGTDPVHDFFLAAKVERANNVSDTLPSYNNHTFYRTVVAQARLNFCSQASSSPTAPVCSHNYFLTSQKNQ